MSSASSKERDERGDGGVVNAGHGANVVEELALEILAVRGVDLGVEENDVFRK
jgi:hypothetical protein